MQYLLPQYEDFTPNQTVTSAAYKTLKSISDNSTIWVVDSLFVEFDCFTFNLRVKLGELTIFDWNINSYTQILRGEAFPWLEFRDTYVVTWSPPSGITIPKGQAFEVAAKATGSDLTCLKGSLFKGQP